MPPLPGGFGFAGAPTRGSTSQPLQFPSSSFTTEVQNITCMCCCPIRGPLSSGLELSGLHRAPRRCPALCPAPALLLTRGGPGLSAATPGCPPCGCTSWGDGGGGEPRLSQDSVLGCCCLPVLSPCLEWEDSGESKQPRMFSVSLSLSFLTPWALSVLHEHLFLVA